MKTISVIVTVRVAWWVRWYLRGVEAAAMLTGCEPDWDRVGRWVGRGVTASVKPLPGEGG
ncbi:hypothetical protein OZ911_08710 [Pseudomonas fortuita]|uniref:Uncharacterized protein n=1 Tax=Pseudomonas fortuita TaxID=3233375 RepID=A0ACD4PB59_9PSED|nr:hypothetical protein [Pseudomonas putida]WAP65466.1 hypothetical protein OZ911_08710 [Pseudomonas putida]